MSKVSDCVPCFIRQALHAVTFCTADVAIRDKIMRLVLSDLSQARWDTPPPVIAQIISRLIQRETSVSDPYKSVKKRNNVIARDILLYLQSQARIQEDPFAAMMRIAAAGSLFDADNSAENAVRAALCNACRGECTMAIASSLRNAAESARRILYLTDNAGEIILDKALIEMLPTSKITVGVRGSAVFDDATMADAEAAGLPDIVSVVANGSWCNCSRSGRIETVG